METPDGTFPISTQYYQGDVESPSGHIFLQSFSVEPWPTWRFRISEELEVVQEVFVPLGMQGTVVQWKLEGDPRDVRLHVRPFLSGRDFHGMHHANDGLNQDTTVTDNGVYWQTYGDLPRVYVESNAQVQEKADWYYAFLHEAERARGLDEMEDLFSPAELLFEFSADQKSGCMLLGSGKMLSEQGGLTSTNPLESAAQLQSRERERRTETGREKRMLDAYLVNRGEGKTIIAGYPWFGDWGRDTFISLRGLCLAVPGRLDIARSILVSWAATVSEGMLPNRFPDQGDTPEFNSVDASLWYVVSVAEYLEVASKNKNHIVSKEEHSTLVAAVDSILEGYSNGTRYGIRVDLSLIHI